MDGRYSSSVPPDGPGGEPGEAGPPVALVVFGLGLAALVFFAAASAGVFGYARYREVRADEQVQAAEAHLGQVPAQLRAAAESLGGCDFDEPNATKRAAADTDAALDEAAKSLTLAAEDVEAVDDDAIRRGYAREAREASQALAELRTAAAYAFPRAPERSRWDQDVLGDMLAGALEHVEKADEALADVRQQAER